MPLSPLPPSNTKRYFIGIRDPLAEHHIQVRVADTVSDAQAIIDLGFTVSLLQPVTYNDYAYHELLVAENGSDIRNPVAGWIVRPGLAALDQPDEDMPLMITGRGRSSSGRKCKFSLWGQVFVRDEDWMYDPVAESDHDAFLDIVQTTPSYFLAIDGSKPVWRDDFTVDYNDHWVQEQRP